jgi:hypothetical protein
MVGHERANCGNCLVAWEQICRPPMYGGLGIHNLELMNWVLRIRWLWLQKTDGARAWQGLDLQVPSNAHAIFNMAVEAMVGNSQSILFWSDRWIQYRTITEVAPNLINLVHIKRILKTILWHRLWKTIDGLQKSEEPSLSKSSWSIFTCGTWWLKWNYRMASLTSTTGSWTRLVSILASQPTSAYLLVQLELHLGERFGRIGRH